MSQPLIRDVHLVGSIRLPDEPEDPLANPPDVSTVMQSIVKALPGRLKRLSDGETGIRHYFSSWQDRVFLRSPWIMVEPALAGKDVTIPPPNERQQILLNSTEYDKFAIASYAEFSKLKQSKTIAASTRFLVGIPPPVNIIMRFVKPEFRAEVEPLYERLLLEAIANIQAAVPPADLAIQFDCPIELVFLEQVGGRFTPWFDATFATLADRIQRLASAVHPDAEVGLHLCYGDINHKHIVEPKDTGNLVGLLNAVLDRMQRPLNFVHLPVPIERTDQSYFHALRYARLDARADLYLGLVHAGDIEGTRKRISAAATTVPAFGISTECGWGRTPVKDISSILEILKDISPPTY